jgi:hypothetical protein
MLKRNIEGPIGGKAPDAMLINPLVRIAPPQDMRLAFSSPSQPPLLTIQIYNVQ